MKTNPVAAVAGFLLVPTAGAALSRLVAGVVKPEKLSEVYAIGAASHALIAAMAYNCTSCSNPIRSSMAKGALVSETGATALLAYRAVDNYKTEKKLGDGPRSPEDKTLAPLPAQTPWTAWLAQMKITIPGLYLK